MNAGAEKKSALSYPAFRILWAATVVSYIGSFVQDIAEQWVILELTHDPFLSAFRSTIFNASMVIGILPAGVLADRYDRRNQVIVSQVIRGLTAAVIAFLLWQGKLPAPVLIGSAAVMGLGTSLSSPAFNALVPEMVPRRTIADGLALMTIAIGVGRAVGPAIGGAILASFGATTSFALNALSFLVLIGAVAIHRSNRKTAPAARRSIRGDLQEPLRFIWRTAKLRNTLLSGIAFVTTGTAGIALAPAYAKDVSASRASLYGWLLCSLGVGSVAGVAILRRARERYSARTTIPATNVLYSLVTAALANTHSFWSAVVLFACLGAGATGTQSSLGALIQVWSPDRLRARNQSISMMVALGGGALGAALGGLLASRYELRFAFLVTGVLTWCVALFTAQLTLPPNFHGPKDSIPPPPATQELAEKEQAAAT